MGVWERRYFRVLNTVMRLLLKSPLHGLRSRRVLLMEFRGRRSGRLYRMPVSYWARTSSELVCLTSASWSRWWINLDEARVTVWVGGSRRTGHACLVVDEALRRELVLGFLTHNQQDLRHYGIGVGGSGQLAAADVDRLADSAAIKVIRVTNSPDA